MTGTNGGVILLASSSPRRRQILEAIGLPFEVAPADVDESPCDGETPESIATRLAEKKARLAAQRHPGRLAIGSDTVVSLAERSLGKPEDRDQARFMLRALRGKEHAVITAVAAARRDGDQIATWKALDTTRVWMRQYADAEIEAYLASGDADDKAGAYAIQHPTFRPVERISGCYLTVVGLSLPALFRVLERAGWPAQLMTSAQLETICTDCTDRDRLPLAR